MAKKDAFRPFHSDSYSGGGTFFNDGLYRIDSSRWVLYDFNGKAPGNKGNGIVCLSLSLQPVDKDGKNAGEAVTQYWSIGSDDAEIENKGKAIVLTGQYPTVWANSDMGVFHAHLAKSKFDMDAVEDENDISVLEGNVFEFGKVASPRTQSKPASDDGGKPKLPAQIVVPVTHIKKGGAATKGGSSKTTAPAADDSNTDHEALLQDYLVEKVMIEKNAKGVERLQARLGLNKYLQQEKKADTDTIKAVSALFNDNDKLGAILGSADWELSGSTIKPV